MLGLAESSSECFREIEILFFSVFCIQQYNFCFKVMSTKSNVYIMQLFLFFILTAAHLNNSHLVGLLLQTRVGMRGSCIVAKIALNSQDSCGLWFPTVIAVWASL